MEKQLWSACSDGKVEEVKKLLQINTNWQDLEYSRTPFYIACAHGQTEVVKLLLNDKRVDINKGNKNKATPFFIACQEGHIDIVKLLLNDNRVDIKKATKNKATPFYIACSCGQTEIVKLLLNDNRVDIKKGNKNEATPFYVACQERHIDIVKLLSNDNRVDINKATKNRATPFYIACSCGQTEIVKLLFNDKRIDINEANNDGETPFTIACYYGHLEVVKYLLVSGREIDINKEDDDGKAGLDWARERGEKIEKFENETEEEYQKAKRNGPKIAELIESFQRNQYDTRTKLRKELGLPESTYKIEHKGKLYKLKTTAKTLLELENDIRLKFKVQESDGLDVEFKENGSFFVLEDMDDLKEGMRIKASISTQVQQNGKNIDDISNLKLNPNVFLTHTWVKDELNRDNHGRVGIVNKLLKAQGFQTWFDEDKMVGHIDDKMSEGIDGSDIILVFITKVYMEKLNIKGHDNCKGEFTYANTKGKKMIPIVMEPCMRDTKIWVGPLGIRLAGDLYVDMSETDSEFNIKALIECLNRV